MGAGLIEALVAGRCQFNDPVKLLWSKIIIEKVYGINTLPVFMHFIMTMRAGRLTGIAYIADNFTPLDFLPHFSLYFIHMAI